MPPSLPPATAGLQLRRLYRSQLILGSIDTGLLLGLALWFAWSARSARLEHRVWNRRQTYFSKTAGALLCLQLLHSAVYVAALGAALDQEGCAFPWAAVAALEFVRVRHALLGCAALRRPTTGRLVDNRSAVSNHNRSNSGPPCPCPGLPLPLQRAVFAFILFFLLVRIQNMKLWRGKGALDMDVSGHYQLIMKK